MQIAPFWLGNSPFAARFDLPIVSFSHYPRLIRIDPWSHPGSRRTVLAAWLKEPPDAGPAS